MKEFGGDCIKIDNNLLRICSRVINGPDAGSSSDGRRDGSLAVALHPPLFCAIYIEVYYMHVCMRRVN